MEKGVGRGVWVGVGRVSAVGVWRVVRMVLGEVLGKK